MIILFHIAWMINTPLDAHGTNLPNLMLEVHIASFKKKSFIFSMSGAFESCP
jgi:hypothetical protein